MDNTPTTGFYFLVYTGPDGPYTIMGLWPASLFADAKKLCDNYYGYTSLYHSNYYNGIGKFPEFNDMTLVRS